MSSLASSLFESKLSFEYDIFLTFFNDLEDHIRTILENCFRHLRMKTFCADIVNVSTWGMEQRCRTVVVVITPEFARSDGCLKRLMNLSGNPKPWLPFFFGVSQNEVYGQLIASFSRRFEISLSLSTFKDSIFHSELQKRADAVRSSLSGFTLSPHDFDDQEALDNLIGKAISQVGLQPRVNKVLQLCMESNSKKNTIMIGLWGVGGIGKTTIARAIYDAIGGHFSSRSFLANIKDVWENNNGQVLLQNQLLSDLHENHMKHGAQGRALIVLDDVNQVGQLSELRENIGQFGTRSLILITTRNKGLLDHFVEKAYEVEKLGDSESLQLFRWHAFKNFGPLNDFVSLSRKVITLCQGLPLVLEVIGSLLHNKTKSKWKKVLNKLENVRNDQIQQKLKISLDFLTDAEKKLFCDIACLHVGQSRSDVTRLFKGSRSSIEMGMQVLIEHSLVKVVNGKIRVHDLLQEIGRGIITYKQKFTYIYDVFLSFRGEDTRKSFVTYLYNALKQSGIEVFMDEEGIERGEHISGSLLHAIESSRISIIIFSQNYAGSSWCLQELEKIMDCYRTTGQEIFPIFYDVQPSDVRKQQNAFGKAWERLKPSSGKHKKLSNNLRRVLIEAANLSGWDMQNYRER